MSEINEGIGESREDGPILEGDNTLLTRSGSYGLKGGYETSEYPKLEKVAAGVATEVEEEVQMEVPTFPKLEPVPQTTVPKLEKVKPRAPEGPPKLEKIEVKIPKLEKVELPAPPPAPPIVKVYGDKYNIYLLMYQDLDQRIASILASFSERTYLKSVTPDASRNRQVLLEDSPINRVVRDAVRSLKSLLKIRRHVEYFQDSGENEICELLRVNLSYQRTSISSKEVAEFMENHGIPNNDNGIRLAYRILSGGVGLGESENFEDGLFAGISLFRVPMEKVFMRSTNAEDTGQLGFFLKG